MKVQKKLEHSGGLGGAPAEPRRHILSKWGLCNVHDTIFSSFLSYDSNYNITSPAHIPKPPSTFCCDLRQGCTLKLNTIGIGGRSNHHAIGAPSSNLTPFSHHPTPFIAIHLANVNLPILHHRNSFQDSDDSSVTKTTSSLEKDSSNASAASSF